MQRLPLLHDACLTGPHAAAAHRVGTSRRTCRVEFEWDGVRRTGSVLLTDLHSAGQLLEALVELGEQLVGPSVHAAQSQVHYVGEDGKTHKMYVTRTKWAELRNARGLMVRRA